MKKFHITPAGDITECKAAIRCAFAKNGQEPKHYPTEKEARDAYERSMQKHTFTRIELPYDQQKALEGLRFPIQSEALEELQKVDYQIPTLLELGANKFNVLKYRKMMIALSEGRIPELVPEYQSYRTQLMSLNASELGYYTKVSHKFLKQASVTLKGKKCLDPFAGNGMLAQGLNTVGVNTIATDNCSWELNDGIEKLDAIESFEKYAEDVDFVMLPWTPFDDDIDARLLLMNQKLEKPVAFIYFGEAPPGCTGSTDFWDVPEHPKYKSRKNELLKIQKELSSAYRSPMNEIVYVRM